MDTKTAASHILVINRIFPPDSGASGLRLMELCHGLAQRGYRITVLSNMGRRNIPNLHKNIRLLRMPFGQPGHAKAWHYPFWLFAFMIRALAARDVDTVLTLTDPPLLSLVSAVAKTVRRRRAIHWVHDLYPDVLKPMGYTLPGVMPILRALQGWALRRQDHVVVIGDDMRQLVRAYGVADDKMTIIPNWPDVESALIDKSRPVRHDDSNPFVLAEYFTVLYSGNFGLVHTFDALLEGMRIVGQTDPDIRLVMAGSGRRFTDVRDKVEAMELRNVHFVREQTRDKFLNMLLAGDLHVAVLNPEAMGMALPTKINSALGLQRPCLYIGPPAPWQAHLLKDFNAGFVDDPNDPQARFQIADAVLTLAHQTDTYQEMQRNAARAAQSISFEKGLNAFDRILQRAPYPQQHL